MWGGGFDPGDHPAIVQAIYAPVLRGGRIGYAGIPATPAGVGVPPEGLAVDDSTRLTVLYSGNVQGVGFRYTARSVAAGFDVTGYVRNLPDGRVELVAEGSPAEVRAFVAAVEQELGGYIRDTRTNEEPPSGRFSDFSIRH
jgi:acylphosphatase